MLAEGCFASGQGVCTWSRHVRQHQHMSAAVCGQVQDSSNSFLQPTLGQRAAPLLGTDRGSTSHLSCPGGRVTSFGGQGGPEGLTGIERAGNGLRGVQALAGAAVGAEAAGGDPSPAPATPCEGGGEGALCLDTKEVSGTPYGTKDLRRQPGADGPTPTGEDAGTLEDASVEQRNERLARAKRQSLRVAAAMADDDRRKWAQERCGSVLVYRWWLTTGEVKLHAAEFCGSPRTCALCAVLRASKMAARYLQRLEVVMADRPDLVPMFVTLTQRTGPDLRERTNHLMNAVTRLNQRRRDRLKGKGRPTFMEGVVGGVGSIEVKRSSSDPTHWHPHYHGLWLVDRHISKAQVYTEWAEIVGQTTANVYWKRAYDKWVRSDPRDSLLSACCEAIKYAVKFDEMVPADVLDIADQLKGRTLIRPFGCLWGVKVPESLTDDETGLSGPYVELCYRYMAGQYQLAETLHGSTDGPKYEEWCHGMAN